MSLQSAFFAVLLALNAAAAAAGPTLEIDANGVLTGARGVVVLGHKYDVEFRDGTCAQVYGDCQYWPEFLFNTYETAEAASTALLETVFLDSDLGEFDQSPSLMAGCSDLSWCEVFTPIGIVWDTTAPYWSRLYAVGAANGKLVWTANWGWVGQDRIVSALFSHVERYPGGGYLNVPDVDLTDVPSRTWAVWTLADAVPEPTSFALLGIGLVGIAASRRRRLS